MSHLDILLLTIDELVFDNADQEICVTYTEMDILLAAKELLNLESEEVTEYDETKYIQIIYNGYKIRAQE